MWVHHINKIEVALPSYIPYEHCFCFLAIAKRTVLEKLFVMNKNRLKELNPTH